MKKTKKMTYKAKIMTWTKIKRFAIFLLDLTFDICMISANGGTAVSALIILYVYRRNL